MANSNVRSGEVVGVAVKNNALEDLGEVAEMVIDKLSGKVTYLVLDFGGFMNFGNKYFAIPWNAFTYNPDEDCFILNIDKERLENSPGFDKDHWPDFSPEMSRTISDYYGL
ncbi:PRC-barrel domain-containing protein [Legionella sp. WA2024007413]